MLVTVGNFVFRYRNYLFPIAFILVLLPGPRLFADAVVALIAGAAIAALGQLIRALTIGLKYIIRGGRNRRVYAEDLVTEGIYGHTRNPMYIGNLLILGGVAVASNAWACLLVALPLFGFLYVAIVAAEENFLRGKFGAAFEAYARAVPRWGLRLGGLMATLHSMQFRWRRLLVKEYGTPLVWITGLCVLGVLRLQQSDALAARHPRMLAGLLLVQACIVLLWAAARWLKKSRTIVAD